MLYRVCFIFTSDLEIRSRLYQITATSSPLAHFSSHKPSTSQSAHQPRRFVYQDHRHKRERSDRIKASLFCLLAVRLNLLFLSIIMSEAPAPRSSTPPPGSGTLSATKAFPSTPRKAKPSSIQDRAVDRPVNKLVDIRIKYDREMQGLFVEVPDGEFQEYFPGGSEPPATKEFKFNVNLKSEEKMYSGVCKGLEDSLPDHEEFIIKDTGRWQDMAEGSTHAKAKNDKQPDLGIYPRHDAAKKAVKIEKLLTEDQEHKLGKRVDFIGRVSWAWLSLSVEVKNKKNTAPFSYDNKEDWLPDNDEARKSRGQLADYAKEIFAHRDVSDYLRKCMNSVIDEDGKDDEDGKGKKAKDDKNDAASYEWPIYKIELDANKFVSVKKGGSDRENSDQAGEDDTAANVDPQPAAKRYLLVGRAMSTSLSPTGRGTKGFAAYDMTGKTHVFLKDTWRPDSTRVHAEGEVYKRLVEYGVVHIATLLYCGDVGVGQPQTTRTEKLCGKADTDMKTLSRIHYRLVFAEIARPLYEYKDSAEMARAIYAALRAHQQAWEKAGILHRDVSDGNIMLCDDAKDDDDERTSTAFLNDWDLAKYKDELMKPPTQKTRSGTWQFISALLLKFPQKQYEVSDDLESFIHPKVLGDMLYNIYDEFCPSPDGCDTGGEWKFVQMTSGNPPVTLTESSGHSELLKSLASLAKQHYGMVPLSQWLDSSNAARDAKKQVMEKIATKMEENYFRKYTPRQVHTNQANSSSAPSGLVSCAHHREKGILSNHSAILAAFDNAFEEYEWPIDDKVENHIMAYTNSGTLILDNRTSSGKRSAENASIGEIDDDEQAPKKRRLRKRSKLAHAASEQNDEANLFVVPESEEED
ncbi:hypothetical protein A0H81_06490 [Grifola frondosa]|uniref:Protein kinase domain-containing protein n=1 Tax=Grifola frondosa TaxID=5627 RepID=A0A1C7MAX6_GRIFR|nr:hypothetical protein A0H81_06490 [Grifola frondosa]